MAEAKYIGGQRICDLTARDKIESFKELLSEISYIPTDIFEVTAGLKIVKSALTYKEVDNKLVFYGSTGSSSGRITPFFGQNNYATVGSGTPAKNIDAGTYTIFITGAIANKIEIRKTESTYDRGTLLSNGDVFNVGENGACIFALAYSGKNFGTEEEPTTIDIKLYEGNSSATAIDNVARTEIQNLSAKVDKITKYVSTAGNDSNDGNTPNTAYASISKALTDGADVIYIKRGTYTESAFGEINTGYRYKGVRIVADNATLNTPNGIHFRYTDVHISGLNIVIENPTVAQPYGLFTLNCTGTLKDCSVSGASYQAFRLDGSKMTLERCVATGAAVDGFNGHTANTGYETECTLIDCKAYNNGDDGLSFHERGTMYVEGGEYYSNGSTGIAPHQSCKANIRNAYIHDNGHSGVEFFNPSTDNGYEVVDAMSYGNLYKNNGAYGLNTQYYNVISVNDKFADNTSGAYNQGTGATLDVY